MLENITFLLPYTVLASHIVFVILFFSLIFRNSWGRGVQIFLGGHAVLLALLVSLAAVSGSLFYSEIVGFEPCVLCWWQRVFVYPQVIIFAVALWKRKNDVFAYAVPMVLISGVLGLYQSYVYMGGTSILPCTALGGACAKNYVFEFGYISIPTMSLTISIFILLLAWANRIYQNENSHT